MDKLIYLRYESRKILSKFDEYPCGFGNFVLLPLEDDYLGDGGNEP